MILRIPVFASSVLLMLVLSAQLKAQQYNVKQYTIDNGLSNNNVMCSLQDHNGFMWFGTLNGLNRFDGRNFKIFGNDCSRANSLGSNFICTLCEDRGHNLWVGTHNGLWRYDTLQEKFYRADFSFLQWVISMACDRQGNLWAVCSGKLYKYNPVTDKAVLYPANTTITVVTSTQNKVYAGTLDGYLYCFDGNRQTRKYLFNDNDLPGAKVITQMCCLDNGEILVGTREGGLKLYNPKNGSVKDIVKDFNDSDPVIKAFIKYDKDNYWIGTATGINIYNAATGKLSHMPDNEFNLPDNGVNTFCTDNDGGIWLGTSLAGENYYNKKNNQFTNYKPTIRQSDRLQTLIGTICTDNENNIWAATKDDGIYYIDHRTGKFNLFDSRYKHTAGMLVNDDELWLGGEEKGLSVIDIKSHKLIRSYPCLEWPSGCKSQLVYTFYKTRNGTIFAGSSRGLFLYDASRKAFSGVSSIPQDVCIASICEDYKGNLWVGTYFSGIYYLYRSNMSAKPIQIDLSGGGRANNTATSICEDMDHNIWISSESNGVVKYNIVQKKSIYIKLASNIATDNTFKILADKHNNIWISTLAGIFCIDQQHHITTQFTKSYGLPSNQFNYNSGLETADGKLYFGSMNGLVSFNPDSLSLTNKAFPLYITGIQAENKELGIGKDSSLNASVLYATKAYLPFDRSSISIDFACLSYVAPETIRYTYKLDGIDRQWTLLKSNRRLFFTGLPPGNYIFRVRAANATGHWVTEKDLAIVITPSWWLSRLAYFAYGLAAVSFIVLLVIYYRRKNAAEKSRLLKAFEEEKNKELYKAKIDFFTNITHEIRTPLMLMVAPLEKVQHARYMEEVKENAGVIARNTGRLVNLTNQLLDFRKTETEGFKLNFIKTDIALLLEDVYLLFKPAAESNELHYTINIATEHVFAFVDPEALRKILCNLIHNAVKYGEHKVQVTVSCDEETFLIAVSNDGPLIPPNQYEKIFEPFFRLKSVNQQVGTGIGLALARPLAELHKGTLTVTPDEQRNVFVLQLPIHQDIEFDFEVNDETSISTEYDSELHLENTILLVEDNTEMADFIFKELKTLFKVLKAKNGKEALAMLEKHVVDLVISDVIMPQMDGFELCRMIKTNINHSHIPVLLLSAQGSVNAKIDGLDSGADVFIEKPFTMRYLMAQLVSLLGNREKLKSHYATSPSTQITDMSHAVADKQFLERLNNIVLQNIDNPDFEVDQLADMLNVSRRHMFRKIKAITGMAPLELIVVIRLKKAAEMLLTGDVRIYEVADRVGFKSRGVFTRNFTRQFGVSPALYVKKAMANIAVSVSQPQVPNEL